jgi:hypothetical protein
MKRFTWTGEMLKEGERMARVRYDLEKIVSRIDTGRGYVDGLSSTTGWITILSGESHLDMGELYTLRLEGGKEVEFHITHTPTLGLPFGSYDICVNGDPEA